MADPPVSKTGSKKSESSSLSEPTNLKRKYNMDKKAINNERAELIAKALEDPIQRKIMYAKMWFPLERCTIPSFFGKPETEEEWADRKIAQLQLELEKFEKSKKHKEKQ
jgi:hypothetical protein